MAAMLHEDSQQRLSVLTDDTDAGAGRLSMASQLSSETEVGAEQVTGR